MCVILSTCDGSPLFLCYPSRFALSALNMEQRDYDSRTALHVAAAEGDTLLAKVNYLIIPLIFKRE